MATQGSRGRVRVMTTGVFDLIHLGHIHMLQAAKQHGDELVVVIARDETVLKQKHNPINPEEVRRQIVESLKPVDQAVLGHHGDIYRVVTELKPNIIALGFDQTFNEADVERKCREHGVEVKVVRLPQFDHDLDATRKIIERIGDRIARNELYTRPEPTAKKQAAQE
jgi:FAD synthetase